MTEDRDTLLRRLKMRSIRRGIREMDLILSDFAERELATMPAEALADYEALLSENDHDLYAWVSGAMPAPDRYAGLIERIARGARGLTRPV